MKKKPVLDINNNFIVPERKVLKPLETKFSVNTTMTINSNIGIPRTAKSKYRIVSDEQVEDKEEMDTRIEENIVNNNERREEYPLYTGIGYLQLENQEEMRRFNGSVIEGQVTVSSNDQSNVTVKMTSGMFIFNRKNVSEKMVNILEDKEQHEAIGSNDLKDLKVYRQLDKSKVINRKKTPILLFEQMNQAREINVTRAKLAFGRRSRFIRYFPNALRQSRYKNSKRRYYPSVILDSHQHYVLFFSFTTNKPTTLTVNTNLIINLHQMY